MNNQNFKLRVNEDGLLKINSNNECYPGFFSENILKEMVLQRYFFTQSGATKQEKLETIDLTAINPELLSTNDTSMELLYRVSVQDETITLSVLISESSTGYEFTVKIVNTLREWTVYSIKYCELKVAKMNESNFSLLWPDGYGMRYNEFSEFKSGKDFFYPSGRGLMQWLAISGTTGGLYIGFHDKDSCKKTFNVSWDETSDSITYTCELFPFIKAGREWTSPSLNVLSYQGTWHHAAKIYKKWMEQAFEQLTLPTWAKNSSGMLLAILKQQNGDILFDYLTGIDRLCDLAEEHGFDTIALFGWAHGGHDYQYPDYFPDPDMGGKEALREALGRANKRGIKTILYANGQLIDSSTRYYRNNGNDVIAITPNGSPNCSAIRKFNSATPVTFVRACPGSEGWRRRMLSLAVQAEELGADGIIYDQMGIISGFCFSENHQHTTPEEAFTKQRYSLLKEIQEHMTGINPDFVIMTEGICDKVTESIHYFHGWGIGSAPPRHKEFSIFASEYQFPELLKYCMPNVVITQRHPCPVLDKHYANYACIYGLRHEIELRYQPDIDYVMEGIAPTETSYSDVTYSPPYWKMVADTARKEAVNYLKTLIKFEKKHMDFFRTGKFVDDEGVVNKNKEIVIKGYKSKDKRLMIVAWNPSEKDMHIDYEINGYELIACDEPENDKAIPGSPLKPESLRVYIHKPL